MRATAPTAYTSDLSIDEALLLDEVGFDPVDFVMGSSFFHIGYQLGSWSKNEEMTVLSQAMLQARTNAMRRLMSSARKFGADGVVGMRILVEHKGHHAEFIAMGTAVKARSDSNGWRVNGHPFSSDLSGQDFWALVRAGYKPRAMVTGSCVYHVAHGSLGAWVTRMGNNCEMPNFTQALYDARELAMERMQNEATAVGATGVVGVHVNEGSYGWHSHVIEFLALGTAIAKGAQPALHAPISPILSATR